LENWPTNWFLVTIEPNFFSIQGSKKNSLITGSLHKPLEACPSQSAK